MRSRGATAAFEAFQLAYLAGLGAFLGHLFPVWLSFEGGKGVATFIGVLLGVHWPAALVFCLVWVGGGRRHALFLARRAVPRPSPSCSTTSSPAGPGCRSS